MYSQERLQEALDVIKADNARRQEELADKYARTHYRDDFHLRNHSKASFGPVPLCRDSDSDLDDEDYNPAILRSQNNKKSTGKREVMRSADVLSQKEYLVAGSVRRGKAIDDRYHKGAFLTLRLQEQGSKTILRNLASRHQTHLDQWAMNNEAEDMANGEERWADVNDKTLSAAHPIHESIILPSRLRNGKVRPEPVMKMGTVKREDRLSEPGNAGHASSGDHMNSSFGTSFEASNNKFTALEPGSSIQTAICIDDDSDDNSALDLDGATGSGQDKGGVYTIRTAFCHPIDFKHTTRPCSFCADYRFGVVGHGIREVLVAKGVEDQIIELDDGHGETHPPTTMCIPCALDRMMMIRCEKHTMSRIEGALSIQELNVEAYGRDLISRDPRRSPHPPFGVKSLCCCCPSPAIFRCGILQKQDRLLNPVQDPGRPIEEQSAAVEALNKDRKQRGLNHSLKLQPPIFGCGLTLCGKCRNMINRDGGKLNWKEIVDAADGKRIPMKRADVEFLFKRGDLWKAYN